MISAYFNIIENIKLAISSENKQIKNSSILLNQKPIESDIIFELLSLEEVFHNKVYTLPQLNRLMQLYVKLIEYFDGKSEQIKKYFHEKMQFLVSRPESIKLMIENEQNQNQSNLNGENSKNQRLSNASLEKNVEFPTIRYSISKKQAERAVKMKILIEVEEQREFQQRDLRQLIKEYEETSKEFDQVIANQLKDQSEQIASKIQTRRRIKRANSVAKLSIKFRENHDMNQEKEQIYEKQRKQMLQDPQNQQSFVSREKLINEVEESVNFMRKSMQRVSEIRRKNKPSIEVLKKIDE